MPIDEDLLTERMAERARLERDISRRALLNPGDLEELLLRLTDTVEEIDLALRSDAARDEPDTPERISWRARARHALAQYRLSLAQVQRRKEHVLSRGGQQT
ncbi:hypothetical protein IGS68_35190 (plasmid) [Skermanella sp. TT6]|uniref:Uncharacterized protein n=1 Tax=Skermanella cutis TaxID=2775420 RepID=A0ABX7BI32_9PROT|nr:hypothetical protein [Skermanella sp. TT6]QQP94058.1 hypothetical protein IGS68_35190 [Skermanella sp. TT6]